MNDMDIHPSATSSGLGKELGCILSVGVGTVFTTAIVLDTCCRELRGLKCTDMRRDGSSG